MKINKIKINAYGNLENKELELKDGINIIQGQNESGKSTLLNCITNTFYGISKNKDGRDISDFDKYKPWNSDEFSSRISYELNNGEKYEVFRDFKKKNPTIYNDKLEDITNQFEIDKKDGSKFFTEQIGVDRQMYLSTVVSMQQEVRLDDKSQNMLVQKIANLAGTGEDNVSYKNALTRLQNKIRDEIGTSKTAQKPINIVEKEMADINKKIEEIKPNQNKKYEIDNQKEEINNQLTNLELEKQILLELKNAIQEENGYIKEADIKEKNKQENLSQIAKLSQEEQKLEAQITEVQSNIKQIEKNIQNKKQEQEKLNVELEASNNIQPEELAIEKNNTKYIYIIIAVILAILGIASVVAIKNYIILGIISALFIADIVVFAIKNKKQRVQTQIQKEQIRKINEQNIAKKANLEEQIKQITEEISQKLEQQKNYENIEKELTSQDSMLKGQIILLQKSNTQIEAELTEIKQNLNNAEEKQKGEIKAKYQGKITEQDLKNILENANPQHKLSELEEQINSEKIKLKGLEIEENTIIPELDNMVNLEENLQANEERYKQLKNQEQIINIAINNLNEAYEEMKTTITPKFTNNLSANIQKISNKKYSKVTINDENGIIVENARGEYIQANKLSTGTIDQLYLSLRLSMINDLSKETLPIILDETFAYFDNDRLENALQYLNDQLQEHQTLIFTCTNREKEALEKSNVKYNLVEM